MCLAKIWTDEQMAEWLEGQGEVIEVWKCVGIGVNANGYKSWDWSGFSYKGGLNKANMREKIMADSGMFYWSGFHCYKKMVFAKKKAKDSIYLAERFQKLQAIKCLILKSQITAIGERNFYIGG